MPTVIKRVLILSILFISILPNLSKSFLISPYRRPEALHSLVPRLSTSTKSDVPTNNRPLWASGGIVSDIVNLLISIKPLFSLMKVAARRTLIGTAEKNGIRWRGRANDLASIQSVLDDYAVDITDSSIVYPAYYTQEFHAYDDGNLNWPAAFECEQATMSMALRVWPKESITATEAQDRLRFSFIDAIQLYASESEVKTPFNTVLDVGCSVGISTFYIAKAFRDSIVTGIDLSPQFLAVAKQRQKEAPEEDKLLIDKITWKHSLAENTGILPNSVDLVSASFVFHELPQAAARDILKEFYRICSPDGMIAITDNNPKSSVIQNLPPALFTLMKSTEPWSDEYYIFDLGTHFTYTQPPHIQRFTSCLYS